MSQTTTSIYWMSQTTTSIYGSQNYIHTSLTPLMIHRSPKHISISFLVIYTLYISNSQTQYIHMEIHDHYVVPFCTPQELTSTPSSNKHTHKNSSSLRYPIFTLCRNLPRPLSLIHIFYPVFAPTGIYLGPFLRQF